MDFASEGQKGFPTEVPCACAPVLRLAGLLGMMAPGAGSGELENAAVSASAEALFVDVGTVRALMESSIANLWLTVTSGESSFADEDGGVGPGSVSLGMSTRGVSLKHGALESRNRTVEMELTVFFFSREVWAERMSEGERACKVVEPHLISAPPFTEYRSREVFLPELISFPVIGTELEFRADGFRPGTKIVQ